VAMKNNFINFRPAELKIQTNNWEISYYVINPQTKKLARKRIKLNSIKSITVRRQYAYKMITEINKKLAEGWNPFIEQEAPKAFHRLKETLKLFIAIKTKELRKSTIMSYSSHIKLFLEWVEKNYEIDTLYIYSVDNYVAKNFLDYVYMKGISERGYNNIRGSLVTIWNWLVENYYAKANVFEPIKKKKNTEKIRKIIDNITLTKIFSYLEKNDKYFYAICSLTYYGLLRGNEILQLKPIDIDISQNIIIIDPKVSKTNRQRFVTIPKKLKEILENININKIEKNNYIFSSNFHPGKKLMISKSISKRWFQIRDMLGFSDNFQFYSLKDTGIVHMLKKGVPPNIVRDQAGHTDLHTTNKYIQRYISKADEQIINLDF